jgi:hypothetical protein
MIVLASCSAVLLLLSLLRVGSLQKYTENGITADAVIGPVQAAPLPPRKRGAVKRKRKKARRSRRRKSREAGRLEGANCRPSFRRSEAQAKSVIAELTIHYMAAGEDAAAAALRFGGVSQVTG